MRSTLEELHITSPSGKTESLYIKDLVTQDELQSFVSNISDLLINGVNYFYIESLQDNNIITFNGYHLGGKSNQIEYSINNEWNSLSGVSQLSLNTGDRVYLRCIDGNICRTNNSNQNAIFDTTFEFNIGGNIETLLFDCKQLFEKHTYVNYNMTSFFRNSKVVNSSKLILPATKLAEYCYQYMFAGCSSLTTAPELPATTLARYCYSDMFSGCTSLTTAPELPATTLTGGCYSYMFQNCTSLTTAPELPATTLTNWCYSYMFQGCTSLTAAPELPATTLADTCYSYMFQGCTSLTAAPELPATTLTNWCYVSMFQGCTSLTAAPELPATTLANDCYLYMFCGCTSLNYIVCLATDISAGDCTGDWVLNVSSTGTFIKHQDMNNWNIGTSGIPDGWAVKDADMPYVTFTAEEDNSSIGLAKLSTYQTLEYSTNMANWNTMDTTTNITLANKGDKVYVRGILSADNSNSNYTQFKMSGKISAMGNCNALWNYQDLNAPLKEQCGYNMFYNCTSLTTAPELPATTLADYCYAGMFEKCTTLITAPELPATELAHYCYQSTFSDCTSLTTAPELPATTLTVQCYAYMFRNCTSLTTAPALPATNLNTRCYAYMFLGCTSLNNIICLATDISESGCTTDWVSNVSSTGTFIKHPVMNTWTTGTSGIPEGWIVEDANLIFVTFTAEEDNSLIGLKTLSTNQTLEYSTDIGNWKPMDTTTTITLVNTGDKVYVRGILSADNSSSNYTQFKMTGKIAASGNCNAIWNYQNLNTPLKQYCGYNMFYNCTSLTTAPELPATTLAEHCYSGMFSTCTSLTTAPELPATTLAEHCYSGMFMRCSSLTTAPELPATELSKYCYQNMFYGCTSLTTAPALAATALPRGCYHYMFNDCTSLNYIVCLATDISAYQCTSYWVSDVSSTGTFIKHPKMGSWPKNSDVTGLDEVNGIPKGWTVKSANLNFVTFTAEEDNSSIGLTKLSTNQILEYSTNIVNWKPMDTTTAIPLANKGYKVYVRGVLSADNSDSDYTQFNMTGKIEASGNCNALWNYQDLNAPLKQYCGCYIFGDCISLTTAPELPATTLAEYCYYSMFSGCTSLTTAPELPATTLDYYCYYDMFNGCTSLNYISCLATDISESGCTTDWVSNVSSTGTFIKHPVMNTWTTGMDGIPEGWTVEGVNSRCVTFTAEENNSSIGLTNLSTNQTLEYSTDIGNWKPMDTTTTITLANKGDKVYVRGILSADNSSYSEHSSYYTRFKMTGKIAVFGNCNAIWNYRDLNAPLKTLCGYNMFSGCTALTTAPELPATTLAEYCYYSMFRSCTSLTTAPELPATTLADYCYAYMFSGCTSLTTAPELPATTLTNWCYDSMFSGCRSLNSIVCLATNRFANYCTYYWVTNVASTGTFIKHSDTTWSTGTSGIPSGWTVEDYVE